MYTGVEQHLLCRKGDLECLFSSVLFNMHTKLVCIDSSIMKVYTKEWKMQFRQVDFTLVDVNDLHRESHWGWSLSISQFYLCIHSIAHARGVYTSF